MPARTKTKESKKLKLSSEEVRQRLKLKHLEITDVLKSKYPHVEKFFRQKGLKLEKLREHSSKIIGTGLLTGSLVLSSPQGASAIPSPSEIIEKLKLKEDDDKKEVSEASVAEVLSSVLPQKARPLQKDEEKILEGVFQDVIGIRAKANLEGEHLNTTYGYIGAEQHLRRYPGDSLKEHGDARIRKEGIAPGLGAWGYFAPSKETLTPELVETERWYAVVQTLYLPDWNKRQPYLKDWYKYRKVLIVNAKNGKAVIAAIADSGPAAWTGKHFGGSPEVMDYLGGVKYKKGAVIVFFVDDPENKIPLGPVNYGK